MPGVTISAESPNLQGIRTAMTSSNGDYILTLLPPGTYKVTFELSGFERQERTVNLAPTQVLPVEVTMGPAAVTETVTVVGRSADVLVQTAQVATNFSQDLLSTLPTNRDINAALLLAPSVHASGPGGGYSISGAMSYENLFLINGATVSENLRGQPLRSVHRGRDSGDDHRDRRHFRRVRPVWRWRRERDHEVGRQPLQRLVPRHAHQRQLACSDAVRRRSEGRRCSARLRVHGGRSSAAGSALVLHGGPASRTPRMDARPPSRMSLTPSAASCGATRAREHIR